MYTYTIPQNGLILMTADTPINDRTYVLRIKDMPNEDKPREKLIKYGPSNLTVSELLAVILTTGTVKEDVLAMSARVVKEYGERALSAQINPTILAADLNIPVQKAAQIVACSELGRRFYQKNKNGLAMVRTAKDVFLYTRDMERLPKEHLRGLYLNSHYRVIHDEVLSIGTINANLIHPREVFKPALEYGAAAVILVHNHPSGITTPSAADIEITEQLVAAGKIMGINLIDHVIVGHTKYISIPVVYS
jgi:DNA repair protein RadC